MITYRNKLWLGIGSYLLAGTSAAALAATGGLASEPGMAAASGGISGGVLVADGRKGGEAGEAGEAGERGVAAADVNVRFLTFLAMMEAHMDVGKRLVDLGRRDLAQPHFHHPYLEVYGRIEKDLSARGIPAFEGALKRLGRAGDGTDAKEIDAGYAAAKDLIAKARATVHADVRGSARIQMQVAMALLKAAAHEYDEAIADGRIHNVEEFQDGWAFVHEAEKAVGTVADTLKKSWPDAYRQVAEQLMALRRAWPDVVPPPRPVATTEHVHATVSRIELAASRIIQ